MKKLPEIYKKEMTRKIQNNQEYTYVTKEEKTKFDLENTLFQIFQGERVPYHKKVWIQTKDTTYETYILGKTKNTIITLANESIPKEDILSIQILNEKTSN